MLLYTVSLSQWRKAKSRGIVLVDCTVKSGVHTLAPTWDLVMGHKSGALTDEAYTEKFYIKMRKSYCNETETWLNLCSLDEVAIACYCPAGAFCHRHLLVDMIEKVCIKHKIDFEYLGELV